MTEPPAQRWSQPRAFSSALLGSILPAVIGVGGTLLVAGNLPPENAKALLGVWTLVGYLALTDLGLTRAASSVVATGAPAHDAILLLRRPALGVGMVMTAILAVVLLASRATADVLPAATAVSLAALPLVTAATFPLMGILEGQGRFSFVAVHKTVQSLFTYLIPPASAMLFGSNGFKWAVALLLLHRVLAVPVLTVITLRHNSPYGRLVVERKPEEMRHLLAWVGLSSLLGPMMLYVDRVFLATSESAGDWGIYYVTLSEIMIKTYVVPAALMSVMFPWTVRHLLRSPAGVARAYFWRIVPICIGLAAAALLIVALLPQQVFESLGLRSREFGSARWLAAIACACTLINWGSQALIGLLQALGRARYVALSQVAMAPVYVGALAVAQPWGVGAVAAAWGLRVVILAAVLLALSWRELSMRMRR